MYTESMITLYNIIEYLGIWDQEVEVMADSKASM